jgi:hypothetical protein
MKPVVLEFVLMRMPFWELRMTELVKEIEVTLLLDLPPTEPMLRPWLPSQYMLEMEMLAPLVTATQSSWLMTVLSRTMVLLVEARPKPGIGLVGGVGILRKFVTVTVVGCWKAIGAIVWRISSAVVQGHMIYIKASTVANAEAVNWVVLDVDVMNGAISKHFCELDEMVGSVALVNDKTNTLVLSSH